MSADNLKKKVIVLFPVQDEDVSACSFDVNSYKKSFKKCYSALKKMKMGETHLIGFVALKRLQEVVLDIEAIRSGNFMLEDNWFNFNNS